MKLFQSQTLLRWAAAASWLGLSSFSAFAYSQRVQDACKADYYQHCSQFSVGTEELSMCMRKIGDGLSMPCLAALADDGQITKAEIDKYYATHTNAAKAPAPKEAEKKAGVAEEGSGKTKASLTASKVRTSKLKKGGKSVAGFKGAKPPTKLVSAGKKPIGAGEVGKSLASATTKSPAKARKVSKLAVAKDSKKTDASGKKISGAVTTGNAASTANPKAQAKASKVNKVDKLKIVKNIKKSDD